MSSGDRELWYTLLSACRKFYM